MSRALVILLCIGVLILQLSPLGAASAEPKRVLLLHSFGREVGPFDAFAAGFRLEMSRQSRDPLEFYEVSLKPSGPGEPSEQSLVSFLRSMYASRAPDLIVPIGGPAATFAERYLPLLFPDTPMLMTAVDERHLQKVNLTPNEAVAAVRHEPAKALDNITRILPQTSTVFVVLGDSPLERFWREELVRAFQPFQNHLTFVWWNELSFAEMVKRSATLPPNSAILYALLYVDAAGFAQTEADSLAELHAVANAPVFGVQSSQMGRGIVGGPLMSMDDLSRRATGAAVRILNHERPETVRIPVQLAGPATFDWRELQRWHISENLLPTGSAVQFREPTLWQRYKWYVVGSVLVCLAEALLISSLLVNLTKRRRAEISVRESREALSDMSQRLIEAQEKERSWISLVLHDDINQRLAALRLQLSLFGKRLPASMDDWQKDLTAANRRIAELINDIQGVSYRLYSPTLKHLGLVPAAEALCQEFSAAQRIDIEFHSDQVSTDMPEEIRLCLFRALQEALQNLAKHSGAGRGEVSLVGGADTIELTVSDEGTGFQPDRAFVGGGLGLPSMKQRLKLVNGQVAIDSKPGRGTIIRVSVPLQSKQKAARLG